MLTPKHTYYLSVVPTVYSTDEEDVLTHTYAFTQHHKSVSLSGNSLPLPGVFFKWDFSPLMIQISDRGRPGFQTLVR